MATAARKVPKNRARKNQRGRKHYCFGHAGLNPHYSKLLAGTTYQRLEVGEYRVIYRADEEKVYVVMVAKRNDGEVYRLLERKQ